MYDAFAGESDEDLLSDDEGDEGPYRDQDRYNEKYAQDDGSEDDGSGSGASSAGKRQ